MRLTPYALWRSRLPALIGTWFARDLTRAALALVEGGRVVLRSVEPARIEATVKDRVAVSTAVEWATGTGPQALRAVCTCGASGVCEHVVATLEVVRTAEEAALPAPAADGGEPDLSWLPDTEQDTTRARARAVWPVLSVGNGGALAGTLYLDTPRLRGVIRDADAILAMMDQTPADDWDDVDRMMLRDDAVQEAFGSRASSKALARALFRLARHPRLRFDDAPGENRHPSELAPFAVETRGVRLRAVRSGAHFVPVLEAPDGHAHLAGRRGGRRRPAGVARRRPHGVAARRLVRSAQGDRRGARRRGRRRARRRRAAAFGALDRARRAVPERGRTRGTRRRRRGARRR